MGFSLERFFEDLNSILSDETLKSEEKIKLLEDLVQTQREYARICNAF